MCSEHVLFVVYACFIQLVELRSSPSLALRSAHAFLRLVYCVTQTTVVRKPGTTSSQPLRSLTLPAVSRRQTRSEPLTVHQPSKISAGPDFTQYYIVCTVAVDVRHGHSVGISGRSGSDKAGGTQFKSAFRELMMHRTIA